MGIATRLLFAVQAFLTILVVGVMYSEIGIGLIDKAGSGGKFSGPFSDLVDQVGTVVPALLGVFIVALAAFVIVGGLTTERSSQEQRRRPR